MGQQEILEYLRENDGEGTVRAMAEELDTSERAIREALWRMQRWGEVEKQQDDWFDPATWSLVEAEV